MRGAVRIGSTATVRLAAGWILLVLGCLSINWWGCGKAAPRVGPADSDEVKRQAIATMCAKYRRSFRDVPELLAEDAARMQSAGEAVVVDVREPEEFAVSHIPDAVLVEDFERGLDRYRDKKVIAYCTIGYRSGRYAATLRKKGFDAYNLSGSMLSWVHAGQPVVDEHGETKRLHVYGEEWDLAPAGYDTVW